MSDQRDKILACACDLYLSEGLEGVSMRELARRLGVTAPALYRHYESREHVLADVVRSAYREFAASLYRALEGGTPRERLVRAGEGYLDFALRHPRWYQLLFISPEQLGIPRLPDDIEAMGCAVHQFWVDRVRECQDAGILRAGDPREVSLTMWGHAHGLVSLYHNGHFRMDEAAFRREFLRSAGAMMTGLSTPEFATRLREEFAADHPVEAHG
ncbi:MAG TPA: TetR/AcrR family transcriptional regulator [Longimicrobiales bacterium]|nr:TetR/AcrR family transcriptional regulator [Longimicrobiales bacterium]